MLSTNGSLNSPHPLTGTLITNIIVLVSRAYLYFRMMLLFERQQNIYTNLIENIKKSSTKQQVITFIN